jgi:hypothetical protein
MKNILIQEFQHSLESKLIEVMNMKMLSIQFVSIVNLLQIQSIEVTEASSAKVAFHQISEALSQFESNPESRTAKSQQKSVLSVKFLQLSHLQQQFDVDKILRSQSH